MRVLLAGATGAIGRPLIRCLIQHGHSVFGFVRSAESTRMMTGCRRSHGLAGCRSRFKSPSRKLWRLLAPTASITRRACAVPPTRKPDTNSISDRVRSSGSNHQQSRSNLDERN